MEGIRPQILIKLIIRIREKLRPLTPPTFLTRGSGSPSFLWQRKATDSLLSYRLYDHFSTARDTCWFTPSHRFPHSPAVAEFWGICWDSFNPAENHLFSTLLHKMAPWCLEEMMGRTRLIKYQLTKLLVPTLALLPKVPVGLRLSSFFYKTENEHSLPTQTAPTCEIRQTKACKRWHSKPLRAASP